MRLTEKRIIPGNRSLFNFFYEKLRVFLAGDSVNVGIRKLKMTKMKKLLFSTNYQSN